jgi:hypothetical protein
MRFSTLLSVIGALASWQNQIDWSLRIIATVIAIIAGAPAAWRFVCKIGSAVRAKWR